MDDQNKSKERLIQELAELRTQLVTERRRCSEISQTPAGTQSSKEQARREIEHRFGLFFEQLPLMYQSLDENGCILEVNQAWLDTLGYSREEIIGKSFSSFLHPDWADHFKEKFPHFKSVVEVLGTEFDMIKEDGSITQVSCAGKREWDDEGNFKRTHCILQDITERKKSEEVLREREKAYRNLFDHNHAVILVIDPTDGTIVNANAAATNFYGYTLDEIIKLKISDINTLPTERIHQEMQTAKTQGRHFFFKHRLANRQIRDVEVFSGPISFGGRELLYSIVYDITDRKRAEDSLRESEEQKRLALEAAQLGTWKFDPETQQIHLDERSRNLFGMTSSEKLDPAKFMKLVHPEDHDRLIEANSIISQPANEAKHIKVEYRITRPDGQLRWVSGSGKAYFETIDEGKILRYIIGTHIDITEHKLAEEALRRLNETLEQQVAERTALAGFRAKQLQRLSVELIEAEEHERQRISNLLHEDFQQILAAARMTLQSKRQRDAETKEAERLLENAISKSRHLSHELSPPVLHHSDLKAALEWLDHQMRKNFGLNVQLQIETSEHVERPPFKVFLFRAVQELLFNVVKHANIDTAHVALSGAADETIITVSDYGKGFDTSLLETYSTKAGLGLRSLRERASYLGGSLTIESDLGKGSNFTLRVPAKVDTSIRHDIPTPAAQARNRILASSGSIGDTNEIRIIFADDHKVMRQGLIRLVSGKPNISVVGEAANGKEAVDLARRLKPNVVVMDVSMPVMDGIEATRRIKAEMPGVHVLGLSMHEDEHISTAIREAGAEAFLSKAASLSELLGAIYDVVGHGEESTPASNKKGPTQLKLPL